MSSFRPPTVLLNLKKHAHFTPLESFSTAGSYAYAMLAGCGTRLLMRVRGGGCRNPTGQVCIRSVVTGALKPLYSALVLCPGAHASRRTGIRSCEGRPPRHGLIPLPTSLAHVYDARYAKTLVPRCFEIMAGVLNNSSHGHAFVGDW